MSATKDTPEGDAVVDEAGVDEEAGTVGPEVTATPDIADEAATEPIGEEDALAVVTAQRDEYLDSLRRLQAEFENYRKRVVKQQADQADRAAATLVDKLLPVLDALDLAATHLGDASSADGRALVAAAALLNDVLAKQGLERIDPLGDDFDPNAHEAVGHVPAGTPASDPAPDPAPDPASERSDTGDAEPATATAPDPASERSDTGDAEPATATAPDPASEPSDTGDAEPATATGPAPAADRPVVAQVMRPGYRWRGTVVRPAMVMVRG